MEQKRVPGLDIIKVLALFFVILYHLTFRNVPDVFSGGAVDYAEYVLSTLMSCCVPLLFLVSGGLALSRPVDLWRSLRRAIWVLFLAVFWAVASLGVVLLLRRESMGPKAFLSTVNELTVGYIQHLWYMPTFFFLCLITPVLYSLKTGSTKVYRYGLAILLVYTAGELLLSDLEYLFRWATGRLGYWGNREYFWYTNFFGSHYWYAVLYYALGAFLLEHREQLKRYRRAAVAAIPLCVAALSLFAFARSHVRGEVFDPVFNNYGSIWTMALTTAAALLLIEVRPGPFLRRVCASVSGCSFGIYLVHWLFIEVLLDYFPKITNTNRFAPLTAIVVMGLSWGISWLCMRIPVVKHLFTVSNSWVKKGFQRKEETEHGL